MSKTFTGRNSFREEKRSGERDAITGNYDDAPPLCSAAIFFAQTGGTLVSKLSVSVESPKAHVPAKVRDYEVKLLLDPKEGARSGLQAHSTKPSGRST